MCVHVRPVVDGGSDDARSLCHTTRETTRPPLHLPAGISRAATSPTLLLLRGGASCDAEETAGASPGAGSRPMINGRAFCASAPAVVHSALCCVSAESIGLFALFEEMYDPLGDEKNAARCDRCSRDGRGWNLVGCPARTVLRFSSSPEAVRSFIALNSWKSKMK